VKGKGYAPAENDPAPWHAPGCFDPESGERKGEADDRHYPKFQKVFGRTITDLAEKNDRIVGITAAMSSGTSLNIMQKVMPERVFDVGISEGHAVTFAGGLAKEGMLPFVAIYSAFIQRAYDNIIHDVAVQELPVTFCIDRAGLVGEDGVTHHGVLDLAYMRAIPGMTVAAPRDADTLRSLLYTAQLPDRKGAWAIRYPRGRGYCSDPDAQFTTIAIGKGQQLRDGHDVNVLSVGALASEVSEALDMAEQKGVSASHYDMIFLKPLDEEILEKVAKSGKPIVTVEDGTVEGGLGGAVLEWLAKNGYKLPVTRIGVPDAFVPQGKVPQLFKLCGMDAEAIAKVVVAASGKEEQV
ncbi:MAG: 1-deoxy-D-xylulose-5-phosphate synthase, partial [Paramuribaculum sp.]|nr:1-deoxy-D-xylulose-5-phosphate synthase [Paramuribaculum sp.]